MRDCEGEVIAMLCATKNHVEDPTSAEALAARSGVELSEALGTYNKDHIGIKATHLR